mmetsp:Transcript_36708/g.97787  ORF Transcript_36708/g.97787 Transcript_36708/m.97787 type:complete len:212 (+) Transcript_36708:207-842(+)
MPLSIFRHGSLQASHVDPELPPALLSNVCGLPPDTRTHGSEFVTVKHRPHLLLDVSWERLVHSTGCGSNGCWFGERLPSISSTTLLMPLIREIGPLHDIRHQHLKGLGSVPRNVVWRVLCLATTVDPNGLPTLGAHVRRPPVHARADGVDLRVLQLSILELRDVRWRLRGPTQQIQRGQTTLTASKRSKRPARRRASEGPQSTTKGTSTQR